MNDKNLLRLRVNAATQAVGQLVCLVALALMCSSAANAQPDPVEDVARPGIAFASVPVADHRIVYANAGDPDAQGLMFIHGTPGDWQAFRRYLVSTELQKEFFMVSVDRLGWGQSILDKKNVNGDFELQAMSIVAVMNRYPDKKWILIGHSLGASIAPKIALRAPQQVSGLLLLAGSLDPKLGRPRWYNRLAATWLAKRLMPGALGRSNDEIMPLSRQLAIMSEEIAATYLDVRLMVMQGGRDKLVSPRNARYVEKHWQEKFSQVTLIELPDAGHFLPWAQSTIVLQKIRELAR